MKASLVGSAAFALATLSLVLPNRALGAASGQLAVAPVSGTGVLIARADGYDIHRVHISGAREDRVSDPQWSDNGRELTFAATVPSCDSGTCNEELVAGAPDGTCVDCSGIAENLTPLAVGKHPSFVGQRGLMTSVRHGWLRITTLTGRVQQMLAPRVTAGAISSNGVLVAVRQGVIWLGTPGRLRRFAVGSQPSWAPSGSRFAYVSGGEILVAGNHRARPRRIVAGTSPSWSPNGRELAFVGAHHQIMEVSIPDGRAHAVGRLRGRSVAWGSSTTGPPRCLTPVGARVLATGSGGSLFRDPTLGGGRALVGCVQSSGVSRVVTTLGINNIDDATNVAQAAVDGPYAGIILSNVDAHYGGDFELIEVFNLATGQQETNLGGEPAGAHLVVGSLDDLVINSAGDTAVHGVETSASSNGTSSAQTEVILASAAGTGVETIASAPANATDTTLANLSLIGTTLTYTNNGAAESAQLP